MSQIGELELQRLMQRFEHEIVQLNRKHIGEITGDISKKDILKMGEAISICRANYLKTVIEMSNMEDGSLATRLTEDVRTKRELYEETMAGFAALRHALERGYVVVKAD